ncbi:MAG: UvrD-helicase domain-containing protein [Succinivibrio sp.]|nr:UvrD-helicase domain-containing protein [Succinivibrio sp.]
MPVRFEQELNQEQLEAVRCTEGYVRVLAGPGTGKTRTLTYRYAYLVDALGIIPRNILCVTFTNKAAREMKLRILKMCGERGVPFIATFHGFCCEFLRQEGAVLGVPENFSVAAVSEVKEMLRPLYEPLGISGRDLKLQDAWDKIDLIKSTELSYVGEFLEPDSGSLRRKAQEYLLQGEQMKALFYAYLFEQRSSATLDFDDLIAFTLEILERSAQVRERWQKRLEYILVDEFQDIDRLQNRLVECLAARHGNLFIVGDPDQTIYTFRGASVRFFNEFTKVHSDCKCFYYEENYRSQRFILDCAYHVIAKNPDPGRRHLKAHLKDLNLQELMPVLRPEELKEDQQEREQLIALGGSGHLQVTSPPRFELIEATERTQRPVVAQLVSAYAEGEYIASEIATLPVHSLGQVAVLYRANHLSRDIEQALIRRKLPYVVVAGVAFMERREIKDVLGYLRLTVNPADNAAFCRIINVPRRGFGRTRLEALKRLAEQEGLPLLATLINHREDDLFKRADTAGFLKIMSFLHENAPHLTPTHALEQVLNLTDFEDMLKREGEQERVQSLAELKQQAAEFERREGERTNLADFVSQLALFSYEQLERSEAVRLMTVHSAKGLEFDYVFVAGLNEKIFPSAKSNNLESLQEERRLLYVAMTRPRKQLFLCSYSHRQEAELEPSRFVYDLHPEEIVRVGERVPSTVFSAPVAGKAGRFAGGARVFHQIFGPGVVESVNERDGEYEVRFESLKEPRTLSFSAPLEPA